VTLTDDTMTDEEKRLVEEEYETACRNENVALSRDELLKNIRAVQTANNIKYSADLAAGLGTVSLDVEMETGTGKTYVYIKTMFELHKAYGWSKFIVVVPSIVNEDKNVEGRSGNEAARIIYTKRDEFGSRRPNTQYKSPRSLYFCSKINR
jgi:restriction endonuclease